MAEEIPVEDLLARLERERLAADRFYNDRLTAVDQALQSVPTLPDPPAGYDSSQLAAINAAWDTLPGGAPAFDGSIKGRLRRFIWRLVGPSLETQRRFNAALVDHLNRNVSSHQQTALAAAHLAQTLRSELEGLVRFQSLLIQCLQAITIYVDSKDRTLAGSEIRQRLALTEQRLLALKRDLERTPAPLADSAAPRSESPAPFDGAVDSLTYVAFEDEFRGSQEEIGRRVEDYVPILSTVSDVVDIGCGRGELLAQLQAKGVAARGVDANPGMVALCRSQGLDAEVGDALAYLQKQPDAGIGGLIAIQVVEHFTPAYLSRFLETAFHKMRPGAPLILETINPACWMAFFETYLRDLTHRQPLHPDTLRHLVQASGFSRVDVQFRAPVPERDRLERLDPSWAASAGATESAGPLDVLVGALNDHADKLNRRLFSSMDYVVVARR